MLRAGETMKVLHTFDISEDDALLASWTEAKIAGVHVGELVAELEVLREADHTAAVPKHDGPGLEPTVKLEDVLGNRLPDICARGLAAVPAQIIRRLFREPSLLIDLQERVLTEGGPYWDKKLRESDELKKRTEAGWARLAATLPAKPSVRLAPESIASRPAGGARWFVTRFAAAAAAAVALVGFWAWDRMQGHLQMANADCGWNRPDAIPHGVSREQYFQTLADEIEECRQKRPNDPEALAQQINEVRAGCSRLILHQHDLPKADQEWLVKKCHLWAKKFDDQLAPLEVDKKSVAEVYAKFDETLQQAAKLLRDRTNERA
jgi:hypothetical protein